MDKCELRSRQSYNMPTPDTVAESSEAGYNIREFNRDMP